MLTAAHERLALEFGFVLWDGSRVPENLSADSFSILIADEGVVAALIRRPNIETFANLWAAARIDLRNGTIFDLVAKRPKVRTKELLKTFGKRALLSLGAQFLFVPRGGPWPLEVIPDDRPSDGSADANKKNIHFHYDLSTPSMPSSSIPRWSIAAPIIRNGPTTSRPLSATSSKWYAGGCASNLARLFWISDADGGR